MGKLERVFFHELGHFVAQELNCKYYKGTGVRDIKIHPCREDPNELCGGTQPNIPEGRDENDKMPPPIERLAQYLISKVHGCMFQCYYEKSSLGDCYRTFGKNDIDYWVGALDSHKLYRANKDFAGAENKYFDTLLAEKTLDPLLKLNPNDYLIMEKPNHYSINMEKLREDTKAFLETYYQTYKELINSHNKLISATIASWLARPTKFNHWPFIRKRYK